MGLFLEEKNDTTGDNSFDLDDFGDQTIYDENTSGQQVENNLPMMDDSLESEQNGEAEPVQNVQVQKKPVSYSDAFDVLKEIDRFDQYEELSLKSNSKDGLMDAVVREAGELRSTKNKISEGSDFTEEAGRQLQDAANRLIAASTEYVNNKNPWFQKGKRRKAYVQMLLEKATAIAENPQTFVDILEVKGRIGSDVAEGSDEYILSQNREKIKSEKEEYFNLKAEMGNNEEKSGVYSGGHQRQAQSLAAGLSMVGGMKDSALKNTVTSFEKALDSKEDNKLESVRALETVFHFFENQNLNEYMPKNATEMFEKDFKRKSAVGLMAWDVAGGTRNAYMGYLKEGIPGLAYDKNTAIEAIARMNVFEMLGNMYNTFSSVVSSDLMEKAGTGFLNILSWDKNSMAALMENLLQDKQKRGYAQLVISLLPVKEAMDKIGFRFGGNPEELMNSERKAVRDDFKNNGIL